MEDLDSSLNEQEVKGDEDGNDVDIYGDLDEVEGKPNVITREESSPVLNEKLNLSLNEQDDVFEDDVDIYGDLKTFDDHLAAKELEAKLGILQHKCDSLGKDNDEMRVELEKVKKINLQLKRNISSIFKTAKAEIERKDKQLKELQSRYDTLLFRRGAKNAQQTAPTTDTSVQSCIRKDPNLGNVITLDNETECTVKMGLVTVSFASEHSDFHELRKERLRAAIEEEKRQKLKQNSENIPEKVPGLEGGEVKNGEKPTNKKPESRRHSRSRSRSRSPLAKRRRSPARNHSSSRDRYERRKHSRSPPRHETSRYKRRDDHRSSSRSHAR